MSFLDVLLGRRLASSEAGEQKIGVAAGVATLGLDGLSSAAYGPEAALTLLIPLGALGLGYIIPITSVILVLLALLYLSYRQTLAAYPTGGGSYTVAQQNLGRTPGLLAAAALLLDYVLNVAVGIAAGMGALVSAFPVLHPYLLWLCLGTLAFITIINLRGVREAGAAFLIPTFLFVGTIGITIVVGVFKTIVGGGHPQPAEPPATLSEATQAASLWLLLRTFAAGCTAMTGVEAVSNGIQAFKAPAITRARQTLTAIVVLLAFLLGGIAFLSYTYHIGAVSPEAEGYESVISQLLRAVFGKNVFYWVGMGATLFVLALSANTSYSGFPRLCRLLALDGYLPSAFAQRGRRLVYTLGIVVLSTLSAVLLLAFRGVTDALIPLFAVGAFLAFTLSQAGMVVHWRREAKGGNKQKATGHGTALLVNTVGCTATAIALVIILVAKFAEGAWLTVIAIPALLWLFLRVKRHYLDVAREMQTHTPIDFTTARPPLVVVPIQRWSTVAERGIQFATTLSPDVIAVHVQQDVDTDADGKAHPPENSTEADSPTEIQHDWERMVAKPARAANCPVPHLEIIPSPYRRFFTPFLAYINRLKEENPDRTIAVVIPELVETRWYQYLLHNQRAAGLKAALLVQGDNRVIVINVPWYLPEHCR